ncbi:MAG: hypothetical protein WDO73_17985 [Ignavibacteriota bacterium]
MDGIKALPPGDVKTALLALVSNVNGDLERAQHNIEHWFDDTMDRVSGWYKRTAQAWTVAHRGNPHGRGQCRLVTDCQIVVGRSCGSERRSGAGKDSSS